MAEVLIVKPGAIQAVDREALRAAGVVVVEADNPHDVVFVRSTETVSSNDMVWAAMDAIVNVKHSYDEKSKERLASNLFKLIAADFAARQRSRQDFGGQVTPPAGGEDRG